MSERVPVSSHLLLSPGRTAKAREGVGTEPGGRAELRVGAPSTPVTEGSPQEPRNCPAHPRLAHERAPQEQALSQPSSAPLPHARAGTPGADTVPAVECTPASRMSGRPRGRHCPSRPVHPPRLKRAPRGRHCPQPSSAAPSS